MAKILSSLSLNYSDVNLIAEKPTIVCSRKQIPNEGRRIVVSGMTSIIGPTFIKAWANLPEDIRPMLHIPRDVFQMENLELVRSFKLQDYVWVGVSISKLEDLRVYLMVNQFPNILIDIANGFLPQLKSLRSFWKGFNVCVGSVHSFEGAKYLLSQGYDVIRSGIAPGSVCITKDATGFTRGTFTEIIELSQIKSFSYNKVSILADGGFSSPADVVKSFLAGADFIMSGKLFTEAFECRMHIFTELESEKHSINLPENTYFGMASELGKLCMGKEITHIEGKNTVVVPQYSLYELVSGIWEGIRSGVSYSGYKDLSSAIGKGVFEYKWKGKF